MESKNLHNLYYDPNSLLGIGQMMTTTCGSVQGYKEGL